MNKGKGENVVNTIMPPKPLTDVWFCSLAIDLLGSDYLWDSVRICLGNELFTLKNCLANADAIIGETTNGMYTGKESARKLADILERKNHDYSDPFDCFSNFRMSEEFGVDVYNGIKVRMCDKVSRIRRLQTTQNAVGNEGLYDAWLDLAGYMVILYAYLEYKEELSEGIQCVNQQ